MIILQKHPPPTKPRRKSRCSPRSATPLTSYENYNTTSSIRIFSLHVIQMDSSSSRFFIESFFGCSESTSCLCFFASSPYGPQKLPDGEHTLFASTANALRRDRHDQYVNPEKVKAAAEGLSQIGMAFFTATTIVFGGAVIAFGVTTSKLELHSSDDIKTKGRDLIQPKFETIREQLNPVRIWAKKMSAEWHVEKKEAVKDGPLAKELSKRLGLKSCN